MQGEGCLEVGLLEAGVHPTGVRGLELGVEVDLVVHGIDKAVQALARAHEGAARAHDEDILQLEVVEADAIAVEDVVGHELTPVEVDRQDLRCDEVDPGRRARLARAERDRRRRREGLGTADQVEVDVVAVDGDQLAALGSLCTGHILAHGVILADPFAGSGGTFGP